MTQKNWLVSDSFGITVRNIVGPGNKPVDLLMIVEPDDGITEDIANILKKPELGFKTNGKGYWVTSKFITKDRKINLSGFGRVLVAEGISVRVQPIEANSLKKMHDDAIIRGKTFAAQRIVQELNKETAILVGKNLQGEDVYQFENGLRAIPQGSSYSLSSDAKNDDENKRFLINGSVSNDTINIDIEFLTNLVVQEIRDLKPSERWSEEKTVELLQKLIKADPQDASNLIAVVNSCHKSINQSLESRFLAELSEDSIKSNGEMKALRTASAVFSRMLPEFNEDGDKVQNYLPPIAVIAKRRLNESGIKVFDLIGSTSSIKSEFDKLAEGESAFVLQLSNSHNIESALRGDIDAIRQEGDLLTAFDLKETQHADSLSLLRVMKFKKSKELASNPDKEALPLNFMSTSQFSESFALVELAISEDEPLPLNRNKLEDALKIKMQKNIKEVEFVPTTTTGSMPSKYVVPASLATPQRKAVAALIEKVGDLGEYLQEKLQLDLATINQVFSKVQVEHISMAISRHEDGFGFVIGDGTGTGKTRQLAALMRYQALNDEQILFITPDKELLRNLWKEIKILKAEDIIVPFVAATEPLKDEDGNPVVFSNGETSEEHHKQLKKIIENKSVIPGKYNAVLTTYSAISRKPNVKPIESINNFNSSFDRVVKTKTKTKNGIDEPTHARVYDATLALIKFSGRSDTYMLLDESHLITGESNTRKAVKEIQDACSGKAYASATAMKNARRVAPYADAMRVPMTPSQLKEVLLLGGEPALEAFSASLTEEGGYVRAEMPTSDIIVKHHIDEQNNARYEKISDSYSDIMQVYLRMIAYVNKAKAVAVDEFNFAIDPEGFKPSAKSEMQIGLNTTGFTSRFTKTNELFIACIKADFIAEEAIETIRSGGKALIPLELTSETNIKFIQETYELPKFTDKQVSQGMVQEWIEIEKAKNPDFKGVPTNFKDVLARMFIESRKIKIPHLENGKKTEHLIDMMDLVSKHLSKNEIAEFEDLLTTFDEKLQDFPELTANPYDHILNRVRRVGYKAEAYAGRHIEVRETEDGYSYFAVGKNRGNEKIRESFQNDDIDCVVMGRSGWTGSEWHSIKDKPVTMINVIPPTSADLDKQLQGRVNRTGQKNAPIMLYTSTGLLVETRLNMQAVNRVRLMNATSKGDANMDAHEDDVQLFTPVGIEAVKRYLIANIHVMEKLGFNPDDLDASYASGGSLSTAFTARVQMLKNSEAKVIMAEVESEYYSYLNELAEQGIKPFGQPVMDVEATISKGIQVDGLQNSDNPWQQPVYLAQASYTERLVIQSSSDVLLKIKENEDPKNTNGNQQSSVMAVNQLKATQRFDSFSKHLQNVADDTYKAIRKLTSAKIDDIGPDKGKLFSMREKYERASEMSKLLSGMKLGQVVRLSVDSNDMSQQVEGVVTDIQMINSAGYSPTLTVAVPGKGEMTLTAIGCDKLNVTKTAIMFNGKTSLANEFDSQDTTINVQRVAVFGPPFATIMKAASILKSNGHKASNAVKIVNMTIHDEEKGKYVQKVALLPKDMNLLSVMSSPMELNASQCANYIRFAGDHVRTMTTSASKASMSESDLALNIVGSDATGGRTIIISGSKKYLKKLVDDENMQDFGVDSTGQPGFGGSPRTKNAQIEIQQDKIFEALTYLEEEHGIRFFSSEFGMKFIQDFNSANLPSDYKAWLKSCRDELMSLHKDQDSDLDLNEIINGNPQPNANQSVALAATP